MMKLAIAASVCVISGSALADVTLLSASADNTLYQNESGSISNGAGEWFFAGKNNQGLIRRGLLRFDVSSIPANATIESVSLTLYHSLGQPTTAEVSLHRVLASWGEGTSNPKGNEGSGGAATPGDATWLFRFFDTTSWTAAGGDFTETASAATLVGPTVNFYNWTSAGMVNDVQAWTSGTIANQGWELIGDETVKIGSAKRFSTRENAAVEQRPVLTVVWSIVGDLNGDGLVNAADLALLLGAWGTRGPGDLDGDGSVGAADLTLLLGAWSV